MHSSRFNLVILPAGKVSAGPDRTYQLSATRGDGSLRLVSPHWQERKVRSALAQTGISNLQTEELLRGNSMSFAPRSSRRLSFTESELLALGLTPVVVPA